MLYRDSQFVPQDKLAQELGDKERTRSSSCVMKLYSVTPTISRSLRAKWEGHQESVRQAEAEVKTTQEEQTMPDP